MRTAIIVLACLSVAACSPTAPVKPEIVYVTVTAPCIKKAPHKPSYQTGKGEWPGDKAAAAILAGDFEMAEQYGVQWETAAIGCVNP